MENGHFSTSTKQYNDNKFLAVGRTQEEVCEEENKNRTKTRGVRAQIARIPTEETPEGFVHASGIIAHFHVALRMSKCLMSGDNWH